MATTENGIYYPNDKTKKATILSDLQQMAESIDTAIKNNKFNPTQINDSIKELEADISNLQESQVSQDSDIEALTNALPSETQEGETVNIKGTIPVKFKEFSVKGNNKQEENVNLDYTIEDAIIVGGPALSNSDLGKTAIVKTKPNTTYTISRSIKTSRFKICESETEWDKSNNFALQNLSETEELNVNYTTSSTGNYLYIFYWYSSGGDTTVPEIDVTTQISPDYPSPVKCVGGNINYFNKDTATEGKYLTYEGTEVVNTAWTYTDFISCTPHEKWIISGYNTIGGAPARCFYNKDKELISGGAHNSQTNMMSFTTPDNCYYFRDSIAKADIDTVKIEKGDTATSYSKFGEGSIEIKKTNENMAAIDTNYYELTDNGIKTTVNSVGKKISEIKLKKGQTIKIGFMLLSKPSVSTTLTGYILTNSTRIENASFSFTAFNNFNLNQKYEKTYTATEDVVIYYMMWGNANDEIFEFQLWAELDELTDYIQNKKENYILPVQREMLEGDYFAKEDDGWKEVHGFNKKIFDGTENISTTNNGNSFSYLKADILKSTNNSQIPNIFSNFYCASTWVDRNDNNKPNTISYYNITIGFDKGNFATVEEFKADLAQKYSEGNPLYVFYPLAEPTKLPCTSEQEEVLDSLVNSKAFEGETNIFSTYEPSPIFKVTAVKDINSVITQLNQLILENGGN